MSIAPTTTWARPRWEAGPSVAQLVFYCFAPRACVMPRALPAGFQVKPVEDYLELLDGGFRAVAEEELGDEVERLDGVRFCYAVVAEVFDPSDLGYLQAGWELVRWFAEHGATVVCDLPAARWVTAEQVLALPASRPFRLPNEVSYIVESNHDPGVGHLAHTRGMLKFGRPDVVLAGIALEQGQAAVNLLGVIAERLALGEKLAPGATFGVAGSPLLEVVEYAPGSGYHDVALGNQGLVVRDATSPPPSLMRSIDRYCAYVAEHPLPEEMRDGWSDFEDGPEPLRLKAIDARMRVLAGRHEVFTTGYDDQPGVLRGCLVFARDEPASWLYVALGLSEELEQRTREGDRPFELTMRVPRGRAETKPPGWPAALLSTLATRAAEEGRCLRPGDRIDLERPLVRKVGSRLRAVLLAEDVELGEVDTPRGTVALLQAVGITTDENQRAAADGPAVVAALRARFPDLHTDLLRPSIFTGAGGGDEPEGDATEGFAEVGTLGAVIGAGTLAVHLAASHPRAAGGALGVAGALWWLGCGLALRRHPAAVYLASRGAALAFILCALALFAPGFSAWGVAALVAFAAAVYVRLPPAGRAAVAAWPLALAGVVFTYLSRMDAVYLARSAPAPLLGRAARQEGVTMTAGVMLAVLAALQLATIVRRGDREDPNFRPHAGAHAAALATGLLLLLFAWMS